MNKSLNNRNLKSLGAILFIVIVMFIGFSDDTGGNSKVDGFTIEAYNVVLDVQEDNKVNVTEYITVDWNEFNHHGILKFIPQWLEYTGKDNKTIKRKSVVSNLVAVNEKYSIDFVKKKVRIKIGSSDENVPLGEKQYIISYTYDMGSDPYKNFDEFIFHVYGDYWNTEIKNASMQINMPKSIENSKINFFTDKYRKNNVNNFVEYTIKGNTIYAKFDSERNYRKQHNEYCNNKKNLNPDGSCNDTQFKYKYVPLTKSLTVDIELEEDYFVGGSWNYGWLSFAIICIIIILTLWTIINWIKYGKDYPKRAKTVEFYPPENYSSAEIGYIYNKRSSKKLTIALIIQLASKGYIKIDELKDKKQIQITNISSNPPEIPKLETTNLKREIIINKLKDADNSLSPEAITMMKYLFRTENKQILNANIDKFLNVSNELVTNKFIEIESDNENLINNDIVKLKQEYEKKYEQYLKDSGEYYERKSNLKPLSDYEQEVYNRLFESKNVVIISEHKTLYRAFDRTAALLEARLKNLINDKKATNKMKTSIFISIFVCVLHFINYCKIEDMAPSWGVLYTISFICIFINIFFTIFMKRKTEYGEEITAKISGFRDFLITVEKPKLEELVAQNPTYFYDILPYTYVLNISKKWINKFEDIPIPEMDMGTFDYYSDSLFDSISDDIYTPEPVYSNSSSNGGGGCSSCGGGCSSCGGGCSSCGGGGSW